MTGTVGSEDGEMGTSELEPGERGNGDVAPGASGASEAGEVEALRVESDKIESGEPETGRESEDLHPLADLDRVVHSPARLMVMTSLYVLESADFVFLVNMTGLTWGNLSSHLSTLEEAGYVEIEKKIIGKRVNTMVSLTDQGRTAFKTYKRQMQQVLEDLPD